MRQGRNGGLRGFGKPRACGNGLRQTKIFCVAFPRERFREQTKNCDGGERFPFLRERGNGGGSRAVEFIKSKTRVLILSNGGGVAVASVPASVPAANGFFSRPSQKFFAGRIGIVTIFVFCNHSNFKKFFRPRPVFRAVEGVGGGTRRAAAALVWRL